MNLKHERGRALLFRMVERGARRSLRRVCGKANLGWRTTWDVLVVGNFIGNGKSQVLLYDRAAGQADVVGFDLQGAMNLDYTNSGWRTTWDSLSAVDSNVQAQSVPF
ncbi:MAG TPA: hypothetical protein VGH13_03500 [Xanthobacteraceae bacterium]